MEQFTITELSYAMIAILGAFSGLLMVIWRSRCRTINICFGACKCDREVLEETDYEMTTPTVSEPTTI
jgi:hypothetical protein